MMNQLFQDSRVRLFERLLDEGSYYRLNKVDGDVGIAVCGTPYMCSTVSGLNYFNVRDWSRGARMKLTRSSKSTSVIFLSSIGELCIRSCYDIRIIFAHVTWQESTDLRR